MKRLILTFISILLLIIFILSLLGLKGDYNPEREFWGINRKYFSVITNLESTPDYTIEQLANQYRIFIKKQHGSFFAQSAQLMLGELYALRKNYVQARTDYQKAVGVDKKISAQAKFGVAKTYEVEGNWSKALVIYKNIIQDYPTTSTGFVVPMYLANHVYPQEQRSQTDMAYVEALAFYQKIAVQNPKSRLEYNSLRLIALCQLHLKNWSGAVKTMEDLIMKYPTGKALQEAVNTINILCVSKLHNYTLGMNIYQQFINKYPDHPANTSLNKIIEKLKLLKDKNLQINTSPKNAEK